MAPREHLPHLFTPFPRLPQEIRLQIWDAVCQEERVVAVLPGEGHLNPITHRCLAVPPLLHTCAEARQVGLAYYKLDFHPNIYLNSDRDLVMWHVTFPSECIDPILYSSTGFRWRPVRRMAVLLDDISFEKVLQSDFRGNCDTNTPGWSPERFQRSWDAPHSRNTVLLPFSTPFMMSLPRVPHGVNGDPCELVLLVLPPLTARPNPVAQRIDLVDLPGANSLLSEMEAFLNAEMQIRATEHTRGYCTIKPMRPFNTTVRFATCTPWEPEILVAESALITTEDKSATEEPTTDDLYEFDVDPLLGITCTMPSHVIRNAIEEETRQLKAQYFNDIGLGPHFTLERINYGVSSFFSPSPYSYEAVKWPIWQLWHGEGLEQAESNGHLKVFKRNGLRHGELKLFRGMFRNRLPNGGNN